MAPGGMHLASIVVVTFAPPWWWQLQHRKLGPKSCYKSSHLFKILVNQPSHNIPVLFRKIWKKQKHIQNHQSLKKDVKICKVTGIITQPAVQRSPSGPGWAVAASYVVQRPEPTTQMWCHPGDRSRTLKPATSPLWCDSTGEDGMDSNRWDDGWNGGWNGADT